MRNLIGVILGVMLALCFSASAMQFNTRAAAVFTTNTTQVAADTSIVLSSAKGLLVPPTPCFLYWYNSTDYSFPMDDPLGEVIMVTKVATDTITVVRGQLNTAANNHNIGGKTYTMAPATPGQSKDVQALAGIMSPHTTIGDAGAQSNDFGTSGLVTDLIAPHTAGNVVAASLGGAVSTTAAPLVTVASCQVSAAGVACTAGSTDDTLFTYTLPANALKNVGDWVRVTAWGTPSATATTYKLFFGGTAFVTDAGPASASAVCQSMTVIKTAANTQIVMTNINYHGTTAVIASAAPTTAAITDTAAIVIKHTANSSAATSKGNGMIVEFGGAGNGVAQ